MADKTLKKHNEHDKHYTNWISFMSNNRQNFNLNLIGLKFQMQVSRSPEPYGSYIHLNALPIQLFFMGKVHLNSSVLIASTVLQCYMLALWLLQTPQHNNFMFIVYYCFSKWKFVTHVSSHSNVMLLYCSCSFFILHSSLNRMI